MFQKRRKICIILLIFIISDASAAAADAKNLRQGHSTSQTESEWLLSLASLADATNPSGVEFCVANPSADPTAVTSGLNWACGPGSANCTPIQPGQACYVPNNLTALASFAYNDYYQRTRATGGSCNFNNTAMLTPNDPSFGSCIFRGSSTGTNTNTNTSTSPSPSGSAIPGSFVPPPPGTNSFVPIDGGASRSTALPVAFLLPVIYHFLCSM